MLPSGHLLSAGYGRMSNLGGVEEVWCLEKHGPFSSLFCFSAGKMNCTHPLVPEYGGFRCDPSPCQGFPHKTTIRLFCESGYQMRTTLSRCRNGKWGPPISACIPMKGESLTASSQSYSVLCFCLRSSKVIRAWC